MMAEAVRERETTVDSAIRAIFIAIHNAPHWRPKKPLTLEDLEPDE